MSSPGLLSLQAFTAQLEVEVKRAQRYGRALSVGLIALDGLRELGAQTTSDARDAVLGAIGRAITGGLRGSDLACRTGGGDEFAVLFAETGAEQAARATRRLLAEADAAGARRLVPAAAVAELAPHENPEVLLARARGALGLVRFGGGNRVAVAPPAPVGPGSRAGGFGVERS